MLQYQNTSTDACVYEATDRGANISTNTAVRFLYHVLKTRWRTEESGVTTHRSEGNQCIDYVRRSTSRHKSCGSLVKCQHLSPPKTSQTAREPHRMRASLCFFPDAKKNKWIYHGFNCSKKERLMEQNQMPTTSRHGHRDTVTCTTADRHL